MEKKTESRSSFVENDFSEGSLKVGKDDEPLVFWGVHGSQEHRLWPYHLSPLTQVFISPRARRWSLLESSLKTKCINKQTRAVWYQSALRNGKMKGSALIGRRKQRTESVCLPSLGWYMSRGQALNWVLIGHVFCLISQSSHYADLDSHLLSEVQAARKARGQCLTA